MSSLLRVRDLNVRIGTPSTQIHAVRGVDLDVGQGELVSIVGESGCGKSMTALALMGLLPPQGRRSVKCLELDRLNLAHLSEREMSAVRGRKISMIFQDPMTSLNPTFTIGEQLQSVYFRHVGRNRKAARERSVFLLEQTGIPAAGERLGQYPHQLSGGLRQRVMIAMALMCEPQLIVADEPTTALDVTIQVQILTLLKKLQADFGLGVLLITHDMGVVARTADRLMVMYAGEVVETGRTGDVFANPRHPYTHGLLDSILVPGKTRRAERLSTIPGIVPNLFRHIQGCAFRERCPRAVDECAFSTIPLAGTSLDRTWRCIRPHDAPVRREVE